MPNESPNAELTINVNIKGRAEPILISVPASMTPNEIVSDLQSQNQLPSLTGRRIAVTHGSTNLQLDVGLGPQGVQNNDTLTILWDGALAQVTS
jgi:hypothetical protein